jgi:hypothetical protein
MVADTLERLRGLANPEDAWIITSRDLRAAVRAAVPSVPPERIIGNRWGRTLPRPSPLPPGGSAASAPTSWRRSFLRITGSSPREPRDELANAARVALDRRAIVVLGIPPT